ncbi:hypothetical protein Cmtc_47360 [Cupriavidus sp. TKC]|nr:hypothetical protein Cmtc_47360 [Cupriavidus sp. TKC]
MRYRRQLVSTTLPAGSQSRAACPTGSFACYHCRWEFETNYRELKQAMLGAELALRVHQRKCMLQENFGGH